MNKRLLSIMLGLSLVIGATSMAFAQETDKKDETKKKKKKKKEDRSVTSTATTIR